MAIQGSTRVYGIIGWPVQHSLSPLFQNAFLAQQGMDACYVPFPIAPEDLESALSGLHACGIQGLNVTIPHKAEVCRQVEADHASQLIGAVNTLKRTTDGWLGCNTDYLGIQAVLQALQADVSSAVIFGAGGTSRAAIHALSGLGCQQLTLTNRTRSRAEELLTHARSNYADMNCQVVDWREDVLSPVLEVTPLCINCSSIGLHPDDRFPFQVSGEGVAMDAVYRPDGQTAFCQAAAQRRCCDGLPMLVAQGAASFAWWHDSVGEPDIHATLRWMEQQLDRRPLALPGWMDRENDA